MGEPVDDVNNRIAAFRDEAAIFCALVEEMRQGRPQDLYARLMRSMTRLAYLVEELPGDLAWNADDDDGPRMNTEDWMALFRQVGAVVEPDVSGLTVVFGQTGQEHDAAQALRLADDLVDVYRDPLQWSRRLLCRKAGRPAAGRVAMALPLRTPLGRTSVQCFTHGVRHSLLPAGGMSHAVAPQGRKKVPRA